MKKVSLFKKATSLALSVLMIFAVFVPASAGETLCSPALSTYEYSLAPSCHPIVIDGEVTPHGLPGDQINGGIIGNRRCDWHAMCGREIFSCVRDCPSRTSPQAVECRCGWPPCSPCGRPITNSGFCHLGCAIANALLTCFFNIWGC